MTTHATRTARTTPRPSLLPSPLALAAALLLAGTGAPAQAQVGDEPGMGSGTPQLREVVITSRRTLEERFMATGSMVVVDRQDMENMGVDSAADVLRQLPGLQVGTNANGNVEVRMRGMDARSTRVLIDGQSASSSGPLTLDQLPVDLIERIEVVRSPSAEFSGSGGGTVNIVLRQASRERSTMFRLTDGIAWGQHTGRLWLARTAPLDNTPPEDRTAPTWSSFSGLWLAEQLMGSDTERTQTTNGQVSEEIESRNRTQRQDWWLVQRINGRIGRDQLNLRATLSGSLGDGRFETRSGGSTQVQTADTQRQNWQLGGDWTRRLAIGKLETTLSGSNQDDEQLRQGGTRYSEDRSESTWLLRSKLTGTRHETLLWMTGLEFETRQAHSASQRGSAATEHLRSNIDRAALWGQNEWELPGKTTLTLGLRAESVQLRSNLDNDRASQQLSIWQPSLHTRTPVGEDAQWRFNLARVTRQPNVADLLDRTVPSQGANSINNPETRGNPDLQPEVMQTLDLAWEQRLAGQGQFGVTGFLRQTDHVIATQVFPESGTWIEQRQNIGQARTLGVEADVRKPLAESGWARSWMLTATAAVLDSEITSGPRQGQAIPGQARYTATLGLAKPQRRQPGTFGGATLNLTGPASLSTSVATGREQARATLDVHVGQSLENRAFWRVGIFNLGDAPMRRSRQYTSNTDLVSELSRTSYSPRIFASIGAQF